MKHFTHKNVGNPAIIALEFKDAIPMALMFMRFQEYTEGIKSIREDLKSEGDTLLKYYEKRKKIYYKHGWAGFNLRGDVLAEIDDEAPKRNIMWNTLEQELLGLVPHNEFGLNEQSFVIGFTKGDKRTLKHELHHAYYYLNPEYREQVNEVLNFADLKKAKNCLKELGYHVKGETGRYILLDEINAYAMTDKKSDVKKLGLPKETLKRLRKLSEKYVY